jgi:acyl-CoA synthetase (AMP-forming)/AMP-acid ligase II
MRSSSGRRTASRTTFWRRAWAPGDKVTLLAKSSINWVVAFVAIMKIRAVCVPLNYRLMPEDVANSISDAKCRFVLTTSDYRGPTSRRSTCRLP